MLDDYLALPYTIELVRDEDDEGNAGYLAEVEELPGCLSQGATPEEAIRNIFDAMEGWLSVALEDGTPIPEPRAGRTTAAASCFGSRRPSMPSSRARQTARG